jgi:transglutaminase-like putative cysteine protease/thioredoxin-like negative regulator of GroEL
MSHPLRTLCLVVVVVLVVLPTSAEDAVLQAAEQRLASALGGGLTPEDFAHLRAIGDAAHALPDWNHFETMLRQLEAAEPVDPLIRTVLDETRAELLLAQGDADGAKALFAGNGGLSRWWAHGPRDIEELADFGDVARLPDGGWRSVPGTDPGGWVALDGLGWPARRQLLVLATTVVSPRDQPVALRLGAAQVARIWVNGEIVLTTDHPLVAADDQVSTSAWLREGSNMIAIAVASESDAWWLRMRITAPDGSNAEGLRETADPPALVEPLRRPRPEIRAMEPLLRESAERGNPDAALSLAAWLVDRSPYPRGSGDARAACEAARTDDPAMARMLEWVVTEDPARQRELLTEAVEAGADPVPARLELARWSGDRGLWNDASRALGDLDDSAALHATALVFAVERWGALALDRLVRFVDDHPNCMEAALGLAEAADSLGRPAIRDRAMAAVRRMAPAHPHLVSLEAAVAKECGDGEALERLMRSDLAADPNRSGARISAALLALADGRGDEARGLLVEGLERSPTDIDLRMELARLEHRVGNDDEAVTVARSVLTDRPQERDAEELLELLGAISSDTSWVLPPSDLWALADAADHLVGPNVVLLDRTEIRLLPDNLTEERIQQAFLVRNAQRSESLQVHHLPYVRESQRMRVLAARVLRRDGSEASAIQRDTPRLAEPEFNLYYDTRLRRIRFPDLEDGDLLEITYILTETVESNDTGAYQGGLIQLGHPSPVLRSEVVLSAPEGGLPAWELGNLEGRPKHSSAEGTETLRWSWRDLPALAPDLPRPPDLVVQPHLAYSNHPDWGDLADWYARHVAPRIRVTPSVEAKARDLVSGATTRDAKIARIYRYVADQIRYVGLEFGEHRYRPFSATWVIEHGIGDCKDTAALLVALYEAVGIPARMVMIRTGDNGPVVTRTAIMEGFNHAIAYLPDDDLWLDGTASGHDPFPPPGMDQGAWALVVDGEGSHPITTPTPGAGRFSTMYRLERHGDGPFEISVRTEDVGEAATIRRSRFAGSRNPLRFSRWLQQQFPGAELVGEPEYDLTPGLRPVVMDITGRVDALALTGSGGLRTFPGDFDLVESLTPTEGRSTPLLVPVRPDLEWTVTVATGRPAEDLPEPVRLETDFGLLDVAWRPTDDGLEIEGRFQLRSGVLPAADYPALRRFLVTAKQTLTRPVEVP